MDHILALDATTDRCSAALTAAGGVIERVEATSAPRSRDIVPLVEAILAEAGLSRSVLDLVACCHGPGSFTGVRVTVGVAQGLALGLDRPVAPLSTLAVLAQGAVSGLNTEAVLTALDARKGEVYWGAYRRAASGLVAAVVADAVLAPEAAGPPGGDDWVGVGPGFARYEGRLAATSACRQLDADRLPHARDLLPLASAMHARGGVTAPERVTPCYLRDQVVQ